VWTTNYANYPKRTTPKCAPDNCGYWQNFPPFNFYAAWKYAQVFGGAKALFDSMSAKIEAPPTNSNGTLTDFMIRKPYMLNLYAAGYQGYLELQKLAGYSETAIVRGWYNTVLTARINQFSKDTPYWPDENWGAGDVQGNYNRTLSVARNFMFLTPELGAYLNQHLLASTQNAMTEYEYVAPYWFVSMFDNTTGEGTFQELYDSPALFQAKAFILKESREDLTKYLDVPAFEKGDLFYIQNLVAALQAPLTSPEPSPTGAGVTDYRTFLSFLPTFNLTANIFDLNHLIGLLFK
jgi:hypothetical protein